MQRQHLEPENIITVKVQGAPSYHQSCNSTAYFEEQVDSLRYDGFRLKARHSDWDHQTDLAEGVLPETNTYSAS